MIHRFVGFDDKPQFKTKPALIENFLKLYSKLYSLDLNVSNSEQSF